MVLEEQRNWIAMKEEVTLMSLGSQEKNGSMYSMLVNSLWEEKTKNRAYFIANELAQIEGESFAMPEASTKYGLIYVKNPTTFSLPTCPLREEKSLSQRAFSIYTDIRKLQDKAKTSYTLSIRRLRFGYE